MKRFLLIMFAILAATMPMAARRTVTPVGSELSHKPVITDSLPGDKWIDSVAAAQPKAVGNIYPLWDAVQVSVDLWQALNRAFRSGYGITGFEAKVSIHNRYFPAFEAGISSSQSTPDGMNYSFHSPLSPYFKIGMDYNFLYNSDSAYKVFALIRYGIASFDYRFTDVNLSSSYWDQSATIDFPWRHTTSGYIEAGAGLQVKLFGNLAAGWTFRYHRIIHHSSQPNGSPWSVPGFGQVNSSIGLTLSLTYTFQLHKPIIINSQNDKNKE